MTKLAIIKHTLVGNSIDVMKNESFLPGFHLACKLCS